jgi:hypothetical protein
MILKLSKNKLKIRKKAGISKKKSYQGIPPEFHRKAGIPPENRRKNRRKIAGIPAISMVRSGTVFL